MQTFVREASLVLDHWPLLAMLAVVWAGMAGWIGRGLGFHRFFRDDKQLLARAGVIATAPPPPDERISYAALLRASPAFWSHFATVGLAAVAWIGAHSDAERLCAVAGSSMCARFAWGDGAAAPLVVALAAALAIGLLASWRELRRPLESIDTASRRPKHLDRASVAGELGRGALGGIAGIAVALAVHRLALWIAPQPGGWALHWFAALVAVPLIVVSATRVFLACLSVICLFIGLALVFALLRPIDGAAVTAAAVLAGIWLLIANSPPFKLRLPGFPAAAYREANRVDPDGDEPLPPHPAGIDPVAALAAWHARVSGGDAGARPKLVLLATSGGAYRAAFWTALLLDKLADCERTGHLPGITGNIRLVTGASGGMVAGAYFAAMAGEHGLTGSIVGQIEEDTVAFQRSPAGGRRHVPIRRDSLTPVLQRMLRRDLPRIFWPAPAAFDRGRVLDAQWRTIDVTFADLHAREAAGIAPSIVLSPMLVESGAPAFFSNLALGGIRSEGREPGGARRAGEEDRESVEVFAAFPAAYLHDADGRPVPEPGGAAAAEHRAAKRGLTLATAVRLNATFPYISPAVSLPTGPSKRRLVDAGYYDNYGVDIATAYLNNPRIREWIEGHCSGVAVLQIRAFPEERPVMPASPFMRALHFLSSPGEALFAARRASQMFRNNQQLRLTQRRYRAGFLRVFTFEASVEASMSWYLGEDEIDAMQALIGRVGLPEPRRAPGDIGQRLARGEPEAEAELAEEKRRGVDVEFDRLVRFWNQEAPQSETGATWEGAA